MGVASPTELFGAYPPDDWLRLLAQDTVNSTGLLGRHNATARLWNRYRQRFLSTLDAPGLTAPAKVVSDAAAGLLRADSQLLQFLKGLRRELSLEYDEPYVLAGQN